MDYWKECIGEACDDAGLSASPNQIDIITAWVMGAHDNSGHGRVIKFLKEIESEKFNAFPKEQIRAKALRWDLKEIIKIKAQPVAQADVCPCSKLEDSADRCRPNTRRKAGLRIIGSSETLSKFSWE